MPNSQHLCLIPWAHGKTNIIRVVALHNDKRIRYKCDKMDRTINGINQENY